MSKHVIIVYIDIAVYLQNIKGPRTMLRHLFIESTSVGVARVNADLELSIYPSSISDDHQGALVGRQAASSHIVHDQAAQVVQVKLPDRPTPKLESCFLRISAPHNPLKHLEVRPNNDPTPGAIRASTSR